MQKVIYFCLLLGHVFCGPDLCENGLKIDSITWVKDKGMWFFTSGGHYWYIKDSELPPKVLGKPLPGGFKKGSAAFYKNNKEACADANPPKPDEQEIRLTEMIDGQNKIMIFDTKTGNWLNGGKPIDYNMDKALSEAKVSRTKAIDAAWVHSKTYIVVIQNLNYSVVATKHLCNDPGGYGDGKKAYFTTDLDVNAPIDAIAEKDGLIHLFQDLVFYEIVVKFFDTSTGRFGTVKRAQRDIKDFFRYDGNCEPVSEHQTIETIGTTEASTDSHSEPPLTQQTQPEEETDTIEQSVKNEEEKGFPWIVIIIVVLFVILAIILLGYMAMRKGKGNETAENVKPPDSSQSKRQDPTSGASKSGSKTDNSNLDSNISSKMSVRSTGVKTND